MQSLPPALLPLGQYNQFICWFAWPSERNPAKLDKIPCAWWDGSKVDAHAPGAWTDAAHALACAPQWDRGYGAGVGFVLTDADPFFFVDVDGAYDRSAGAWSPIANDFVRRFAGAAVEVSMSGVGLHIIGCCQKPFDHAKKNTPQRLEFYTSKRFIALTGTNAQGNAATNCNAAVAAVAAEYFPPSASGDWAAWTYEPAPGYTGPPDDEDLINRALASGRSAGAAFGGDVTFADLWNANADVLGRKWPGLRPGAAYDASSADQALANSLAFWTGKNCERMRALMERSALRRDKWYVHRTYLAGTVTQACAFVREIYTRQEAGPPAGPPGVTGGEYAGPEAQLEIFAGCYYDRQSKKIFSLRHGSAFEPTAFNVSFPINAPGRVYILDAFGQSKTGEAWKAFTLNRVNGRPTVDGLWFRPELPYGEVTDDGENLYLNTYRPYVPVTREGDPAKFVHHVQLMFPNGFDALQVLSYFAAVAQYPGVKFQWWPVIQGIEGGGKSFLGRVLRHLVGAKYVSFPNTSDMARNGIKFNAWIDRKLLLVLEEVALSRKRDLLNELKPYVTNDVVLLEKKGQDQTTTDNRANGVIFTNFKDGVPISAKDRRYAIFYAAQQTVQDLLRDMPDEYFRDLWAWAEGTGPYAHLGRDYGLSVVAQYLRTMAIEQRFNPHPSIGPNRAPDTTSKAEALLQSLGAAEQDVLEIIEEGRPGFAGGWVSSKYLATFLEQKGHRISANKRTEFIEALGYSRHPALGNNGRTGRVVMPDNTQPLLFLREGHLAFNLSDPKAVADAYEKAQARAMAPSAAQMAFDPPRGV